MWIRILSYMTPLAFSAQRIIKKCLQTGQPREITPSGLLAKSPQIWIKETKDLTSADQDTR
jgi:hypothetical protein